MPNPVASIESLDVIRADLVDPAVEGIRAELAALGQELALLLREADVAEAELANARRASVDDERVLEVFSRVLGTIVQSARANLHVALEAAVSQSTDGLLSARGAAESLLADFGAVVHEAAAEPDQPPDAEPDPSSASEGDAESADEDEEAEFEFEYDLDDENGSAPERSDATATGAHAASPWAPPSGPVAPPEPAGGSPDLSPSPAPKAPTVSGGDSPGQPTPSPAAPAGTALGDKFGAFWHHEPGPKPTRRPKFSVVDALMPVIIVSILAVLLLSWVG